MTRATSYFIGDSCICWAINTGIGNKSSNTILWAFTKLKDLSIKGVRDIVPSYTTLAIHFDPIKIDLTRLTEKVDLIFDAALNADINTTTSKVITLPVVYNGPDIQKLENLHELSKKEIIRIHTKPKYFVAMIGFLPHFPYLIGLDTQLHTPRLDSPRTRVPAGSVGIGGAQAGIYPQNSPGGWNLIGITDPDLLTQLQPADCLRFQEVESI